MRSANASLMRKMIWAGVSVALSVLAFACSNNSAQGGGDDTCGNCQGDDDVLVDSGTDATLDSGDASCVYPDDAGNDPACPATYNAALNGTACPRVGLSCGYPGAGDIDPNGCSETAALVCNAPDAGVGTFDAAIFDDAGDSGIGYWTAAQ
jgi:hypothetical protein